MPFKGKQPREGSEHLRMDAQWLTGGGGGQPQTSKSYEKMMENHYKMPPPPLPGCNCGGFRGLVHQNWESCLSKTRVQEHRRGRET